MTIRFLPAAALALLCAAGLTFCAPQPSPCFTDSCVEGVA